MSGHTPTPWIDNKIGIAPAADPGHTIALFVMTGLDSHELAFANRDYTLRAVNNYESLLAALEAFVWCENASDHRGPRWDGARLDEAVAQARAAIAQAKGEAK